MISITVIRGRRTTGTPLGMNMLKYLKPCLINPIIVTGLPRSGTTLLQNILIQNWLIDIKMHNFQDMKLLI